MWLWLSLTAVILFTALNLLFRVMAVKSLNPRIFSFVFNSIATVFAFFIMLTELNFIDLPKSIPPHQIGLIILAVILYGVYERTHFLARKYIESSILVIIYRLAPLIAFLGSILLFGEILNLNKALGTLLIIGATIVVAYKNTKLVTNKGFWLAIFVVVVLGFAWMLDKPGSANIPPSLYSFLLWFLPLPIIAMPKIALSDLKKEFKNAGFGVVLIAFLNALGFYIQLKALSLADASRVIPIVSSASVLTIIGGMFVLNEKSHFVRKLIAGAMMFGGILLLK